MGNKLFGVDIAGIVARQIGPGLMPVQITRMISGARDPADLTAGRARTPQTFAARGVWEDLPRTPPPGVTFELNDRIALLIGDTIEEGGVPQRNDAIQIEGLKLWVVQLIERDPAAAAYRYLCRDRAGPDGV